MVVGIEPSDWERAGFSGPLAGVELQRTLERAAFTAGGGALVAPASRATDFMARRASSTLPASSYIPGLVASDIASVLDSVGVSPERTPACGAVAVRTLDAGVTSATRPVLIGVESRTSSPVRVPRDAQTLASIEIDGLYPAGEGGGYAGGIVSAAARRHAHRRGAAPEVQLSAGAERSVSSVISAGAPSRIGGPQ